MRTITQRVTQASVQIGGTIKSRIQQGLVILTGFETTDNFSDVEWMAAKICRLRIFNDDEGVMNLSVSETSGEILVVSQFTLHASTRKGNRPSYIKAARPETAIPLYEAFIRQLEIELGRPVATGEFGAMMKVDLVNDGPVTIFIDSRQKE